MSILRSLSILGVLGALASTARAKDYGYTVLGPDGPVFRHVIEDANASCKSIELAPKGGTAQKLPMTERFRGSADPNSARGNWPIVVCEKSISYTDAYAMASATIDPDGARLAVPLPVAKAERIAVIGDTGCRIKIENKQYAIQPCKDPAKWPLAKIAGMLAAKQPQLVIHEGDYIYRKADCPNDRSSDCGGSPYGVAWDTLRAELFEPAAALLRAAPWAVPRGNHENCATERRLEAQGGIAFFILLDPRPFASVTRTAELDHYLSFLKPRRAKGDEQQCSACAEMTPPYVVPVDDDLELWILDSNFAEDEVADSPDDTANDAIAAFAEQFAKLSALSKPNKRAWLVTHRPLYGLYPGARKKLDLDKPPPLKPINQTLQEAFELAHMDQMTKSFDLALTGHMHAFQVMQVMDQSSPHAPNITVGNSGTQLDDHFTKYKDLEVISRTYKLGTRGPWLPALGFSVSHRFGGLLITRTQAPYDAELFDPDGASIAKCAITPGKGAGVATVTCDEISEE
ncbi:MAG TPA: metallophosphoesterase [Kofleriaceae bacterium]|jgi:hypothetical protein|nr:metallophosphoesterase [Kofleriaceae bacterium]